MEWIKSHKLVIVLLIILAFLLLKDKMPRPPTPIFYQSEPDLGAIAPSSRFGFEKSSPQSLNTSDRMVIKESNMSLLVEDVRKTGDEILTYVKNNNGFMVTTSYTSPTESPFASITVRIPSNSLDQVLSYSRGLAIRVTSENLIGTDVTEDYVDIEARLLTLQKTKAKFEDILEKAISVQDILIVQRELINLQDQIDALTGQKQAIEKNVELSKITIYLSTDELALPYAPDKAFRPQVIFKHAVRSLLTTLQTGAEVLIWIAVYSPLIAAVLLVYILSKRFLSKNNKSP